jgi:hypothetical protein
VRVIVCGSRTFSDPKPVDTMLYGLWRPLIADIGRASKRDGVMTVVEGGAKGADALAAFWAQSHEGVCWIQVTANWSRDGKAAGPIRNQRMLDDGEPDLVLAFVDKPLEESRGTADMVRRARQARVPVYVVQSMTGAQQ